MKALTPRSPSSPAERAERVDRLLHGVADIDEHLHGLVLRLAADMPQDPADLGLAAAAVDPLHQARKRAGRRPSARRGTRQSRGNRRAARRGRRRRPPRTSRPGPGRPDPRSAAGSSWRRARKRAAPACRLASPGRRFSHHSGICRSCPPDGPRACPAGSFLSLMLPPCAEGMWLVNARRQTCSMGRTLQNGSGPPPLSGGRDRTTLPLALPGLDRDPIDAGIAEAVTQVDEVASVASSSISIPDRPSTDSSSAAAKRSKAADISA